MVGRLEGFYAPVHAHAKIVLQIGSPARECILPVRRALPGIRLVGPEIFFVPSILLWSIASSPASKTGMLRIVHPCRHEIQEGHSISLFLPMRGVGRIKRAERAMTGAHISLEIESACAGRQCREPVKAAFAVNLRTKRVHPERKWRR